MTVIDAHQHYWLPARGDYGWLQPGSPLDRAFLPGDLQRCLDRAGVAGTILVQAAPTLAETEWLLALRRQTPHVLGIVGWIDLDDAAAADHLAALAAHGLVGIRPMLQDLPDPDWILGEARAAAIRALAAAGLAFDALVRPAGLRAIAALADRHGDLSIVLDHAGKPPIGSAAMEGWWADLAQLAERPNCVCKLSGLITEAPPATSRDELAALVRRLGDLWGPERLIWGSDWPVLTLARDYGNWLSLAQEALGGWTEEEKAAVFGDNAKRVYRL